MTETDVQETGSRKRVGLIVGGVVAVVLVVALVAFQAQIKSALKLLFKTQPVHAKHIPRQSFLVSRTNLAALALKTGLQKSPNDPLYKKMRELGSKLYPRFEELVADPEKETGLDLADDVYAFSELVDGQRPSVGILFGISDKKRFAEFVQRVRPGAANEADGISLVRLDGATVLCWNKSFALVYGGLPGDALEQRAKAVMAMESRDSIVDDAKKKAWIEGRDDCLVSLDLGQITALPDIERLLRKGLYRPEIYAGSILQGALNFDKGKFLLETTASGAALLAEAKKTSAPPSKDFLAGIPVSSYQGFLAGRVPFAYLVESYRQADQNLYDKVNGMVLQSTSSTLAALAESLTGDLCLVFEGITPPSTQSARPQVAGTLAFGIKPGSALETVVHNNLRNAPPAIIARDGSFYRITMANATYLVAGNGYLALASNRAAAQSMAERRPGAASVMPAALLNRATDSTGLLELKLGELFTALAAFDRLPGDARSAMEILGSYLKELNVSSRLEQDRATSRMELLFKNTSRNSLNQFASLSMALAEVHASRGQVR